MVYDFPWLLAATVSFEAPSKEAGNVPPSVIYVSSEKVTSP